MGQLEGLEQVLEKLLGEQLALARGTFAVELYFGSGEDIGDIYAPLATIPADPTENFADDLSVRHSMNPPAAGGPQQSGVPLRNTYRAFSLSENNSRKSRWTFPEFPEPPVLVTSAHARFFR